LKHYVRKASESEVKEEKDYPLVIQNEELQKKIEAGGNLTVLDVREPAEYSFGHIPGAKSIPLGELENRADELDKESEVYVVCRTGNRSDLASKQLTEKGFKNVKNVVQGMVEWSGLVEKNQ
jgi:rhodanese-related sulfurtransferase